MSNFNNFQSNKINYPSIDDIDNNSNEPNDKNLFFDNFTLIYPYFGNGARIGNFSFLNNNEFGLNQGIELEERNEEETSDIGRRNNGILFETRTNRIPGRKTRDKKELSYIKKIHRNNSFDNELYLSKRFLFLFNYLEFPINLNTK